MCRFLSLDFEYNLKCPVDKQNHTVRFQAFPHLRGHVLDVVELTRSRRSISLAAAKLAVGCLRPVSIGKRCIRSPRLLPTVSDPTVEKVRVWVTKENLMLRR